MASTQAEEKKDPAAQTTEPQDGAAPETPAAPEPASVEDAKPEPTEKKPKGSRRSGRSSNSGSGPAAGLQIVKPISHSEPGSSTSHIYEPGDTPPESLTKAQVERLVALGCLVEKSDDDKKAPSYSSLKKDELVSLAAERAIEVSEDATKAEIIEALEADDEAE